MASIPLQKIRLTGLRHHSKILLQELQKRGNIQITENKAFDNKNTEQQELHNELFDAFDLARIDFAIRFLEPHAEKKGKLESMLTADKIITSEEKAVERFNQVSKDLEGVITECETLEEQLIRNANEIKKLETEHQLLDFYKAYPFNIGENTDTETTITLICKIIPSKKTEFFEAIAGKTSLFHVTTLNEDKKNSVVMILLSRSAQETVQAIFAQFGAELVNIQELFAQHQGKNIPEIIAATQKQITTLKQSVSADEKRKIELAKHIDDIKLCHDFFLWRQDKNDMQSKAFRSKNLFALEGWVPTSEFKSLSHWVKHAFAGEVVVDKIPLAEGEKEPSLMKNKPGAASFQMITEMFGAPKTDDIDPTPVMTPFFIMFFGICLSDVGYGAILALVSGFFLKFGTFSQEAREKLVMILLCGASAILGGILLGGWFGMTPEQFPLLANPATGDFYGQILNPLAGNGAMVFLLFSFGLGFFQLLVGVFMDGLRNLKNGDKVSAWADSFAWLYFLLALAGWALADIVGLPKQILGYMAMAGAGILVITQGRSKKNIFAKIIFGVLGLYGIMDYVSNMLSYSRLMALGLATGIIGSAMNTTAGVLSELVTVPVLGTLIAIAFVVFGHSLNFALSLLGAFIHSMRLQFIEFFGRFYQGGSKLFTPFKRAYKYLYLKG